MRLGKKTQVKFGPGYSHEVSLNLAIQTLRVSSNFQSSYLTIRDSLVDMGVTKCPPEYLRIFKVFI